MIDPITLRELIAYDPTTGAMTWQVRAQKWFSTKRSCSRWNSIYAGTKALHTAHKDGYRHGEVLGMSCLAHRAAWALSHGEWPDCIDHINGDRSDNRLANLRSVSKAENARNMGLSRHSTTGVIGISLRGARWIARIRSGGRLIQIGTFDSLTEASEARRQAQIEHGFHPNHGQRLAGAARCRPLFKGSEE